MKKRKITAFLLMIVMIVSVFTGCKQDGDVDNKNSDTASNSEKKEQPKKDTEQKPMDISIAIWDIEDSLSGGESDKILQTLQKETKINIVSQNITWDDADQKIKLWAASDGLPDIFAGDFVGKSFFYDWIDQGVIRALPDDLSDYPNLQEYLKIERAQAAKQDGKFYMIPRQTYGDISYSVLDRSVAYRWDLAQKAGITKEPETYDEFRDMIKKIIEADPEGKKITGLTATQPALLTGFILPYGTILEKKWIEKDGQWMPGYFAGDMEAAFQLARDMYQEGTIEKDISLAKINTSTEKFLQGKSAAILIAGAGPASLYNTVAQDYEELYEGHKFLDDVKICKLFPCKDGKRHYFVDTEAWSESYFSSKVDDEKMERILGLYDYLYSEDGRRLVFCGIEGEDYDLKDDKVIMREGINLNDKYPSTRGICNLATWNPSSWDMTFPSDIPTEYRELNVSRHQDAADNGTLQEYSDAVLFLSTPLKDKFVMNPNDDLMKIMMGSQPVDKMLDDLMAEYESKGLSDMLKEVNEAAKNLK